MGLVTLQTRKVGDIDTFTCKTCELLGVFNIANSPADPQPEPRICGELYDQHASAKHAEVDELINYCELYQPLI